MAKRRDRLEIPRFVGNPFFPIFLLLAVCAAVAVSCNLLYPHVAVANFAASDVLRPPTVSDSTLSRSDWAARLLIDLRGRHIWAVAQLLEWIAMILTTAYAIWLLFGGHGRTVGSSLCSRCPFLDEPHLQKSERDGDAEKAATRRCWQWIKIQTLVLAVVLLFAVLAAWPFMTRPLNPFDLAGRVHGELFIDAWRGSGRVVKQLARNRDGTYGYCFNHKIAGGSVL